MVPKTCSIEGCEKVAKARGWCNAHWLKWRKYGDPAAGYTKRQPRPCTTEGCEDPVTCKDRCNRHYLQWRRSSGAIPITKNRGGPCEVEGCNKTASAKGWCFMHYARWYRHGDPLSFKNIWRDDETRFWSKVDKRGTEGCWVWNAALDGGGYGHFRIGGKSFRAHVMTLEASTGGHPSGMFACHHCDNPKCVNPAHLYWGTHQENMDDAVERKRTTWGGRNANAKVTEADVVAMRHAYAAGVRTSELGLRYGIADHTVNSICLGTTWRNAAGPLTRKNKSRKKAA